MDKNYSYGPLYARYKYCEGERGNSVAAHDEHVYSHAWTANDIGSSPARGK